MKPFSSSYPKLSQVDVDEISEIVCGRMDDGEEKNESREKF